MYVYLSFCQDHVITKCTCRTLLDKKDFMLLVPFTTVMHKVQLLCMISLMWTLSQRCGYIQLLFVTVN